MSAQLWIYTGIGLFLGGHILWIVITELRLWNFAKSALFQEGQIRSLHDRIETLQGQAHVHHFETPAVTSRKKKKKGKR